jgi:hypothetical protein
LKKPRRPCNKQIESPQRPQTCRLGEPATCVPESSAPLSNPDRVVRFALTDRNLYRRLQYLEGRTPPFRPGVGDAFGSRVIRSNHQAGKGQRTMPEATLERHRSHIPPDRAHRMQFSSFTSTGTISDIINSIDYQIPNLIERVKVLIRLNSPEVNAKKNRRSPVTVPVPLTVPTPSHML